MLNSSTPPPCPWHTPSQAAKATRASRSQPSCDCGQNSSKAKGARRTRPRGNFSQGERCRHQKRTSSHERPLRTSDSSGKPLPPLLPAPWEAFEEIPLPLDPPLDFINDDDNNLNVSALNRSVASLNRDTPTTSQIRNILDQMTVLERVRYFRRLEDPLRALVEAYPDARCLHVLHSTFPGFSLRNGSGMVDPWDYQEAKPPQLVPCLEDAGLMDFMILSAVDESRSHPNLDILEGAYVPWRE
ncbi:hypothetical protein NP233_g3522 [Leucocoprinus birnbaumii]|uniref:Uncharacterized protein n=1 Tax=Leucocoprinus birnbaumii TaxID=56174 RepID=A0AAD5VWC3_9AGAR|nr:hypothetical protein NP233_g3522 [Leucocoprinus birnbaumii]